MKNYMPSYLKIGSALFMCVCLFVYFQWETVPPRKNSYMNFTVVKDKENIIHMVPNFNESNRNVNHGTTNAYNTQDREYDLRIIVVVYNRAQSLTRLLNSLNEAEYGEDSIKLEVWIDRSKDQVIDSLTLRSANNFKFKHGQYSIIVHPRHVGIYGQWLTTWRPKINSSEIAVILEDDLTVSRYFYKYLKLVHRKYDSYPSVNGYALQGSTIKHSVRDTSQLQGPKGSLVFLYPVIGTWGFSPNSKNWIKFLDWFAVVSKDVKYQPEVPGNVVSDWFKEFQRQGKTTGMWSIWHIHYAWKNKENTVYSNFKGK